MRGNLELKSSRIIIGGKIIVALSRKQMTSLKKQVEGPRDGKLHMKHEEEMESLHMKYEEEIRISRRQSSEIRELKRRVEHYRKAQERKRIEVGLLIFEHGKLLKSKIRMEAMRLTIKNQTPRLARRSVFDNDTCGHDPSGILCNDCMEDAKNTGSEE